MDQQEYEEELIDSDEDDCSTVDVPWEDQMSNIGDDIDELDDDDIALQELQDAWDQAYQVNQVSRDRDNNRRKSILERMKLDDKACYQCFTRKEGHIWADRITKKIGGDCVNRDRCIFCSHQIIWRDNHRPSIDCPRLPKSKEQFLEMIKNVKKNGSK